MADAGFQTADYWIPFKLEGSMATPEPAMPNNEWLKRRAWRNQGSFWYDEDFFTPATDVKELKKVIRATLWVDGSDGRHRLPFDALPFEEVIKTHFVEEAVVNGFSLWLGSREILWQRIGWFPSGYTIPVGGDLILDMESLNMELLPFILS